METLELQVSKKIYNELLSYLKRFGRDDLVIVRQKEIHKNYLEKQLQELDTNPDFITVEQLDVLLERTIQEYEN